MVVFPRIEYRSRQYLFHAALGWAYLLSGTGRDGTIPENATLLHYGAGRKK